MNKNAFIRTLSAVLLLLMTNLVWAEIDDPQALVRETADAVLAEVVANKEVLEKDNSGLYDLVQSAVVPHFDFLYMSRSALGRHWREASEEQRLRIAHEFKEMLVRTYATALLSYSGQDIEYLPVRDTQRQDRAMIPTKISNGGAPPIPVDYRLHKKDGQWKVYDVVIDGISMVLNYRSSFAAEVRVGGIEGLIQKLAQRNQKSQG